MRRVFSLLVLGLAAGFMTGCSLVPTNINSTFIENTNRTDGESDFTPPVGRPTNPPPASAGERRLFLAQSEDGIHFTSKGKILTDQGNVPDLVISEDGTIRVYYIGQSIQAGKEENTVVAISKDEGETWTFHLLTFKDFPQPRDPSDPDVVLLDDGTYRMYYTTSLSASKLGIAYAESPDGITFTYAGEALESFGDVIDSTTFFFDGLWHMYVLQEKIPGQLHATSTDGKTFTLINKESLRLSLDGYIVSNPLIENQTVRMFAFNLQQKNIRSFTSTDMVTWATGDVALEGNEANTLGANYIQDSSVVQLSDGRYLMVYVSELPQNWPFWL